MATLPDLDTTQVSFVAYWNALDHGVTDIAPNDVINDSRVQSYTLYDNGVTVEYEASFMSVPRTFTVRVKEDGWFVAYIDRTTEEKQNINDTSLVPRGPWDIVNDWSNHGTQGEITQNVLERAIQDLHAQLGNSNNITYNAADVGLYNYEVPSADTLTHLTAWSVHGSGSYRFLYSSSTNILWAWGAFSTRLDMQYSDSASLDLTWMDGTSICSESNSGNTNTWGTLELLNAGLIPNAETNYGTDFTHSEQHNSDEPEDSHNILLLWNTV